MAPHATDDGNMATNGVPLTNGDVPTSRILSVRHTTVPSAPPSHATHTH